MAKNPKNNEQVKAVDDKDNSDSDAWEEEESDNGSSDESDDDATGQETISIDFEARSPDEGDAASIQRLLAQFLPNAVNLSSLTKLIISQNYVGSVVFQPDDEAQGDEEADDDEDIFGVSSIINLSSRKEEEPIKQLLEYLRGVYSKKLHSAGKQDEIMKLFDGKLEDVGWIINERFINLPSAIAPRIFESLENDIREAVQKKMPYKFSKYLLVAKTNIPKDGSASNPIFVNDEEEYFMEDAIASFSYMPVEAKDQSTVPLGPKGKSKEIKHGRMVMLLHPDSVRRHMASFSKLVDAL